MVAVKADPPHVLFAAGERRANDGRSAMVANRNANAHLVRLNIFAGRAEVLGEAPGFVEGLQPAGETQLSGLEGVLQRRKDDATKVA